MCRARTLAEGSGRVQPVLPNLAPSVRPLLRHRPGTPMARIDGGELLTRTLARQACARSSPCTAGTWTRPTRRRARDGSALLQPAHRVDTGNKAVRDSL